MAEQPATDHQPSIYCFKTDKETVTISSKTFLLASDFTVTRNPFIVLERKLASERAECFVVNTPASCCLY